MSKKKRRKLNQADKRAGRFGSIFNNWLFRIIIGAIIAVSLGFTANYFFVTLPKE